MDSALSVVAKRKMESRSVVFVLGRIENKRWYNVLCSVMNVSVQSSLKRDLLAEGFTGYVLRNGEPKGLPVNTGRLHWPTSGDTKSWVFAHVAPKRLSKRIFVESTTEWRRRNIIKREAREQNRGLWGKGT